MKNISDCCYSIKRCFKYSFASGVGIGERDAMIIYLIVRSQNNGSVSVYTPYGSYLEARKKILANLQCKYSDRAFNNGSSIYDFYASRIPEIEPSTEDGWILSCDEWSIWKFTIIPDKHTPIINADQAKGDRSKEKEVDNVNAIV